MQIDRERLALAILNSDRVAGGWPRIETRVHVLHSEGYLRNVDDVIADIEAQGFVIVPREPTEAMVSSGITGRHGQPVPGAWGMATINIYKAMIDAAKNV